MGLLSDARAVLATGPVCDACLGRPFADRSHGLTNAERGRALRVACALDVDEPVGPFAGVCWVCDGLCDRFDDWADRAATALDGISFETYQVGTRVTPLIEENGALLREEAGLPPDAGEPLKSEVNREVGKRLADRLPGIDVDFERPDVVALLDLAAGSVDVRINPAFVYGRYRKLVRGIPQTEWPCSECRGSGTIAGEPCPACDGTGFQYPESVEQLIAPPVREAMAGANAVFHGAGREDIDARMLGTGRPFVVEVKQPRDRFPDLEALAGRIEGAAGDKVEVSDLALATYEMVERVKELDARKTYRATVEFEAPVDDVSLDRALSALDGVTVDQETPERVSHRRADRTRQRTVYGISGELTDDRHATVEIRGEGGLYVKELVSGDDGRTRPSLAGELGVGAAVTALDVLAVEAEDEPFADPRFLREPPERPPGGRTVEDAA